MNFNLEEEDEVSVNKLLKESKELFRAVMLILLNNNDLSQKKLLKY